MNDHMVPIPFPQLMNWILDEKKPQGTVFGLHRPYRADPQKTWEFFGGKLEMPFGPAAGPHTQLAQNLVAAYFAGGRFFELKTVQKIDGLDLPVAKPCIGGDDEAYNVEWSTELYVPEAMAEYIKAWVALHVIAREFGLGGMDGFQFNMSLGYDLEGIKTEKIDTFIEGLKDASQTQVFQDCLAWLADHVTLFEHFQAEDIQSISPAICNSVTLSTLHGCPPQEIERIARYLLGEKKLHTFVKCNPTLLGYDYARNTLNALGYGYVSFNDVHFKNDLQYADAVPMLKRLKAFAAAQGREFGVKLTNTLPVDILAGELPGSEMYMSGKALFPLSLSLAARLAADFNGDLRMSYCGGADFFNIGKIVAAGIWPVTMVTTLLKPGGYQRFEQIAGLFGQKSPQPFRGVDAAAVQAIVEGISSDHHYMKALKPWQARKMARKVPLIDCFTAPCQDGCPIGQDIPAYLKLVEAGRMQEALQVILEKNPLPFITGTICPHDCMGQCTRNFYDTPVQIRAAKLAAAEAGYDAILKELTKPPLTSTQQVAVVGGGPGGLAAAWFLRKGGLSVTLFEKQDKLGGVVRSALPGFRIDQAAIDHDISLITAMGVKIVTGYEIKSLDELKPAYDFVVLAVGAPVPGALHLEQGQALNALDFLEAFNRQQGQLDIGRQVVVIGGGNTAMDTARAAKRTAGVEQVTLVYRRTSRYMPAAEEELQMALAEGVEFLELLAPVSWADGRLTCRKTQLGDLEASGRRGIVETGELVQVPADTVISAVGELVPAGFYQACGLQLKRNGQPVVDEQSLQTSVRGVYAVGDGLYGPASVVEAIRDARKVADSILQKSAASNQEPQVDPAIIYQRKGVLAEDRLETLDSTEHADNTRCLSCSSICESCVEVCPNRANQAIQVPDLAKHQILHLDNLCNGCGNCRTFCPYDSAPYLEKFTLFASLSAFDGSKNQGFTVIDRDRGTCRIRLDEQVFDYHQPEHSAQLPEAIRQLIDTVLLEYAYLL